MAAEQLKPYEEFLRKVLDRLHELGEDELAFGIDDILDPLYCPECGSCGIDGCCPPDRCKTVRERLWCEANWKSYLEMQEEWSRAMEERDVFKKSWENAEKELASLRQMTRNS